MLINSIIDLFAQAYILGILSLKLPIYHSMYNKKNIRFFQKILEAFLYICARLFQDLSQNACL